MLKLWDQKRGRSLFDQSQNRSRKYGGKIGYERSVPGIDGLTAIAGFDALWDTTEQRFVDLR